MRELLDQPARVAHELLARHQSTVLVKLRLAGHPITSVVWPHTEHGIYEYETDADGERTSLRQPAGYLPLLADFARGVPLSAKYGDVTPARP